MKILIRIVCEDPGSYLAECLSLPGCVTRGISRDDAQRKLAEAIRGYLGAVGNFVPENVVQEVVEERQGELIA